GNPPVIDGRFDDPVWSTVDWGGDFTQRSPYEGKDPTQETKFKILYDARYLYFAFRCFDTDPDSIVKRMSRRDGFEGDWVEVNIDSYNDKRTAFSFTTSVSGVKGDEFVSNNGGNWDASWNPIWNTKTNIDSLGWTAEVRIPLSQIRYGNKEEHTWGLQFTRRDFREESRSVWQFIPQNSGNWVSSFGELRGLKGIKPQKQIEIQPYIVTQEETFEKVEGNPFATGSDFKLNAGLDGKVGLTSDLTLDFTINPDFGQVEADPSVLTLDGFRIFFSERRPFFIENRNLFDYNYASAEAGGPFTSDNLFYSRRIGGAPHGSPDLLDEEYADIPDNTAILGAAKFSGKTEKGLGIGILESVTGRETALIDLNGERRKEVVEPLTNYFVGRVTQDFKEGETVVGGMFTATTRNLEGHTLDFLRRNAFTGGIDIQHWWKDRTWFLAANTVFSRVEGSTEAIMNTQTAFEHLFQRPGADHVGVDSTATSLTGTGGTVKVGRLNKKWMLETGVTWRSPELELNDVGFMTNTDEVNYFLWSGYRWTDPFFIFRRLQLNYNHWSRWDFGGNNLYQAVNSNVHSTFKNFWGVGGGITYENKDISNNALFGGPALRKSRGIAPWIYFYSDQRKAVQFQANAFFAWGFEKDHPQTVRISDYSIWIGIQPTNALNLSISPAYNQNERKIQYVTSLDYQDNTRYIAGTVDQRTFSTTLRLNYSITPDLTLQYYGQPFISRGRYQDYKYITKSMARDFSDRFHQYADAEIGYLSEDEEFAVDEDQDGVTDYTFSNPDFSFIQFRSNLVARWEYIPGSEIFLVWSQGVTNFGDPGEKLIPDFTGNLFSEKGRNIFLLKLTYRFLK
ncbi:MAG: carbohydrate binding family 9 domain-containing protein, partial [Phaeodactylibacter sp.]|nr:carbohydrate binding family 9 domain-containing protein [Phaeodactylibacter sp.]